MTAFTLAMSLGLVMQCAIIDFAAGTCSKIRPIDETDGDEHEEEHCEGKDHVGETVLRDAWLAWKARSAR